MVLLKAAITLTRSRPRELLLDARTCNQVDLRQQARHAGVPPPRRAARRAGGRVGPVSVGFREQLRSDEHDSDRARLLPGAIGRAAAVQEDHLHVIVHDSTPCASCACSKAAPLAQAREQWMGDVSPCHRLALLLRCCRGSPPILS